MNLGQQSVLGDEQVPVLKFGANLKICQLNVEGISKDKADYLGRFCNKFDIDVLVLQETHTALEGELFQEAPYMDIIWRTLF